LAYLLLRAPSRAANADRLHAGGSIDLRRELGGYAYIGLQVIIAAAGALMLLYGLGAAGATPTAPAIDAPRSLLAVAWHVADSMPGPDIPAVAGWRPATDFTGPWAGAVVVITVATLIVVVVFPMIRAVLQWAKLNAGQLAPERPLAEVPSALLADLEIVRAFLTESSRAKDFAAIRDIGSSAELTDEQEEILTKMHEAEERLAVAELDRGRLRDLLGGESPVYWAADQAVSEAADAYRTVVRTQLSRHTQWSPWPARGASAADAIAAIDVYAAAVERWQMGADVVAEIESRVDDLDTRERDVQLREHQTLAREHGVETRELGVETRERGMDAREQVLKLREDATQTREQNVEAREQRVHAREQSIDTREESVEVRERTVDAREQSVVARKQNTEVREQKVHAREQSIDAREQSVEVREQNADIRERETDAREQKTVLREQSVETREQSALTRERKAAVREREIDAREQWVEAREQNAEVREQSVVSRERNVAVREREIDAREQTVEVREHTPLQRQTEPQDHAERP
jgi:hypothetical protein